MQPQPHRSRSITTVRAQIAPRGRAPGESRSPRAHGVTRAPDERGFTVGQLLTGVVAALVLAVLVFAFTRPSGTHRPPAAEVDAPVRPVLVALHRDVAATVHALVSDPEGCGHRKGQRAVVSFLADGSAPLRSSWYVVTRGHGTVLLREVCHNGAVESTQAVTAVSGTPLVACTPSCGRFETVRFSYTGPHGLTSVVAYRRAKP